MSADHEGYSVLEPQTQSQKTADCSEDILAINLRGGEGRGGEGRGGEGRRGEGRGGEGRGGEGRGGEGRGGEWEFPSAE